MSACLLARLSLLNFYVLCSQQTDNSSEKMAALTDQLVTGVRMICTCDFTPDHITNGRWDCNSNNPTMVIFRADIVGIGTRESIADDIVDWADTTNNIGVGRERLQVVGATTCQNRDCLTMSVVPPRPYYYWIIGLITGIIVVLIIIAVIVVAVLFWWRYSKKDKPAW